MILSGTFTNNSPQESLGVSINWGDGSPQTAFGLDPGGDEFPVSGAAVFAFRLLSDRRDADRC